MVYVLADAPFLAQREDGVLVYRANYRLTEVVNGNSDGTAEIEVGEKTESELNTELSAAIAAEANLQAATTQFTANLVKGGRI